ncbi:hypothetical protein Q8791_23625 [Nocardiopsis sp. CT-R113]|uniref:Uncharacterized protein n=1 Tax=Nocardiopsis codii TaxID=3065942 RepID=A0ABU7KDA1_9ACTN|nr:hypothetical protein [Nocardiopsis sp. CT-R113]MEE2040210.1 hypothetical protein [Nocardiopsis sp. CT-R113]
MRNLIAALANYTMTQKEAFRGDDLAWDHLNGLWVEVEYHARAQGLTGPQALRAYMRR